MRVNISHPLMDDILQLRSILSQLLDKDVDKSREIAQIKIPTFMPCINEFSQYKQIYQDKYEQIQQLQEDTKLLNKKAADLE